MKMILKLTSFTTGKDLVDINSRYLTVATSHQSCSKYSVSLDLEDRFSLDFSSILRDVSSYDNIFKLVNYTIRSLF
jgi:hypothetical protein